MEHRYYGKSRPFGTMEEVLKDKDVRGYFNSAQAIADYAELLLHLKEKFSAQNSPIIVIGGSYGGMLASWFRMNRKFKTCSHLNDSSELKDYLNSRYSVAAQYNKPPSYPVTIICGGIDHGAQKEVMIFLIRFMLALFLHLKEICLVTTQVPPSETTFKDGNGNDMIVNEQEYGLVVNFTWIVLTLEIRFAKQHHFSNGHKRSLIVVQGFLQDISHNLRAVYTHNGSHCLDILPAKPSSQEWLTMQRNTEVKIIEGWITNYYADLKSQHPQK
ncbi:hypothetical protein HAX54_007129 [Datura stramonium]|uniref:Uncharacterized protein n=1 Tax=Datura stramonium TaxID=4076 RepID=A0ABS8TCJ2_DATST|nr:hypothetical protein [Datura stramonium]